MQKLTNNQKSDIMNQQVIDEIYELEEAIASLTSSSNYDTDVVNELRQQIERLKAQINS